MMRAGKDYGTRIMKPAAERLPPRVAKDEAKKKRPAIKAVRKPK